MNSFCSLSMETVFEALGTLGNTKWRVNKKVLSIIDRIWASGGRLADLVDRDDVYIVYMGSVSEDFSVTSEYHIGILQQVFSVTFFSSARDTIGHGTHTASTAAGRSIPHSSFYGLAEGSARGAVPSARIAAGEFHQHLQFEGTKVSFSIWETSIN